MTTRNPFVAAPGRVAWPKSIQQPLFFPDGDGGGGDGGGGNGGAGGSGGGDGKDAAYYQAEAKQAFKDRDAAKAKLREAQDKGLLITPEQQERMKTLEDAAAKADEEQKRKSGEFDTLKNQLVEKHATELKERDSKISTLSDRFQNTLKRAEFGAAPELFGAHDKATTIFDVDMAIDVLGKYVHVEDTADSHRIVVKNPKGQVIVGKDGEPLPFAKAMVELIDALPNKNRILRGSGITGSGNSGGHGTGHGAPNLDNLKTSDFQDPTVRAAVRKKHDSAGGIRSGAIFEKR